MRGTVAFLLLVVAVAARAEQLGTVTFSTSCAASTQSSFNRGVALLHDFWYEEAQRQFQQISISDPDCAMAHWGVAMSVFHQIWNRPDEVTMSLGWSELEKAESRPAKTIREREYISALRIFYKPGKRDYETRIDAYSAAMSKLFTVFPEDVDAGAFYALSLLANKPLNDTTVDHERQALAALEPLWAKHPDHPGLVHYIIHACDNPQLAGQGLEAAERYGQIAPSAAHAAHMPSHIFARLGMWQSDVNANVASVAAAEKALEAHHSSIFDELHADDFLLYAYLQSGQDARAKGLVDATGRIVANGERMAHRPGMEMSDMLPYFRNKAPVFYFLEMRDWKSAAALRPSPGTPEDAQTMTYWARIVANGHLRQAAAARADLAKYDAVVEEMKRGKYAYGAQATGALIQHDEVLAWAAFAQGNEGEALTHMRAAADLQDKVGQAEVDIPAREMLGDILLELRRPSEALTEYDAALRMCPNRFNGLFHAGQAAEAAGDKARATRYYSALLKITSNGTQSARAELAHAKTFVSTKQAE